jgi:predicted Ser/Thr protein kinase
MPELMDVSNLRVPELRAALKERGLKVSGVKRELVARLTDNLENGKENGPGSPQETHRSPAKKQCGKEPVRIVGDAKKVRQLGETGKEGTVWLMEGGGNEECALKQFKKGKSQHVLKCEAEMAIRAGDIGVGPRVFEYSLSKLQIVMQKLDRTLVDVLADQKGKLSEKQQLRILEMYEKLGEEGIYHNDPNPLNIMEKDGTLFIIDFGMSKEMKGNKFEKYGPNPNMVSIYSLLHRATQGLISRGYLREEPTTLLAGYQQYKDSCGYQDPNDKQELAKQELRRKYGGGGSSSSSSSSSSSRRSAKKKKATKSALPKNVVDLSGGKENTEENDTGSQSSKGSDSQSEVQSDESQGDEEGGGCVVS